MPRIIKLNHIFHHLQKSPPISLNLTLAAVIFRYSTSVIKNSTHNSGYRLLGSQILFETYTLMLQILISYGDVTNFWKFMLCIQILHLNSTLSKPIQYKRTGIFNIRGSNPYNKNRPRQPRHVIHPVMTSNAPPTTSYRDCWHVVSLGFSSGIISIF